MDRPASERARDARALLLVLGAAVVVHGPALFTFFAQDDITWLTRAAHGLAPQAFRPLVALLFGIEYRAFGLDPLGYHVVLLALHLLNAGLLFGLARRLLNSRIAAAACAVLFGGSRVAFTPLHWASAVGDLLACAFLLIAARAYLNGRGMRGAWLAAGAALLAAGAKETALAWPLVPIAVEVAAPAGARRWARVVPSLLVGASAVAMFATTGALGGAAYDTTRDAAALATNLFTYLAWLVSPDAVPDATALPAGGAWRLALPVLIALVLLAPRREAESRRTFALGVTWALAFLLPVLALTRHTYLYYLYVPMAGLALALGSAALGLARRAHALRRLAVPALVAYALTQAISVRARENATQDHLPVDRTLREATLLRHALHDLGAAHLPPGTSIGFVGPVLRRRFDLTTGLPTRPEDLAERRSYLPLEAAFRGGETLRLFFPALDYRGFAATIPPEWREVEVFLPEQRGFLRHWGHGQHAVMRQAILQAAAGRLAAAESSLVCARAMGDTLPALLAAQARVLDRMDRARAAAALRDSLAARWPGYVPPAATAPGEASVPETP